MGAGDLLNLLITYGLGADYFDFVASRQRLDFEIILSNHRIFTYQLRFEL